MGLELGADDYMTKPFSHAELVSRIKANIRRYHGETRAVPAGQQESENVIVVGDIRIDTKKYSVSKNGTEISLSKKEYDVLEFFAKIYGSPCGLPCIQILSIKNKIIRKWYDKNQGWHRCAPNDKGDIFPRHLQNRKGIPCLSVQKKKVVLLWNKSRNASLQKPKKKESQSLALPDKYFPVRFVLRKVFQK